MRFSRPLLLLMLLTVIGTRGLADVEASFAKIESSTEKFRLVRGEVQALVNHPLRLFRVRCEVKRGQLIWRESSAQKSTTQLSFDAAGCEFSHESLRHDLDRLLVPDPQVRVEAEDLGAFVSENEKLVAVQIDLAGVMQRYQWKYRCGRDGQVIQCTARGSISQAAHQLVGPRVWGVGAHDAVEANAVLSFLPVEKESK